MGSPTTPNSIYTSRRQAPLAPCASERPADGLCGFALTFLQGATRVTPSAPPRASAVHPAVRLPRLGRVLDQDDTSIARAAMFSTMSIAKRRQARKA